MNSAKTFLAMFSVNATVAPKLPEGVKSAISSAAHASNQVFHVFGGSSPKLDFMGYDPLHPLTESYYSQVPFRYGEYVAKFSCSPASPALKQLIGRKLELKDENALRTAVIEHWKASGTEFDLNVDSLLTRNRLPLKTQKWNGLRTSDRTAVLLVSFYRLKTLSTPPCKMQSITISRSRRLTHWLRIGPLDRLCAPDWRPIQSWLQHDA